MKFSVNIRRFRKALFTLRRAHTIGKKGVQDRGLLALARPDGLELVASDGERFITAELGAQVDEPGIAHLHTPRLDRVVRKLYRNGGRLTVSHERDVLVEHAFDDELGLEVFEVDGQALEVSFEVPELARWADTEPDPFIFTRPLPERPAPSDWQPLPAAAFVEALGRVAPFMSEDGVRDRLCGADFHVEADTLRLTATDGHTLMQWTVDGLDDEGGSYRFTFNGDQVKDFLSLCARPETDPRDVAFALSDFDGRATAWLKCDGWAFSAPIAAGSFPAVCPIIETQLEHRPAAVVDIPASTLDWAMRLARAVQGSGGRYRPNNVPVPAVFEVTPDRVRIVGAKGRTQRPTDALEIELEGAQVVDSFELNEPLRIGFNPAYVRRLCKALGLGHTVRTRFIEGLHPMLSVRADDEDGLERGRRGLVMPYRL